MNFRNGQVITIGTERLRSPDILFKPSLIGLEQDGLHRVSFEGVVECDVDIRKDLYTNIVISDGSTMFQGIAERSRRR